MRCKTFALMMVAACATPKGPEVCRPVSSWASPSFRCAPIVAVEAPVEPPVETPPPPPPPEPEPEEVIELRDRIQFETDSATLLAKSKAVLDEVVTVLKEHPEIKKVRIEGHTDSTSTPEHNQTLSEQRAAAVKTYLVSKGIAAERLGTKGFGQDKPLGDNDTEEGRLENRRVEFYIEQRE